MIPLFNGLLNRRRASRRGDTNTENSLHDYLLGVADTLKHTGAVGLADEIYDALAHDDESIWQRLEDKVRRITGGG